MPSLAPRIDTLESTPTFSGAASFAAGSAAAPSLRFTVDPTTGLYRIGAGNIGFTCAGVNAGGVVSATWTLGSSDPLVHVAKRHDLWGRELRLNTTADQNAQLSLNVMASAASFNKTGYIVSSLLTAQDSASGAGLGTAAMTIVSKKADDYLGTNGAALVNRPLFYFQNNTSNVAECLASGAWAFCTGAVSLIPATSAGGATIHGGTGDTLTNDPMIAFSKVSSTANRLAWKVGITSNGTAQSDFIFRSKTTASSAESDPAFYTEVFRIGFSGACTIGASGASGTKLSVNKSGTMPTVSNSRVASFYTQDDETVVTIVNGNATYSAGTLLNMFSKRAANSAFGFISCVVGDGTNYNITNAFFVDGRGVTQMGANTLSSEFHTIYGNIRSGVNLSLTDTVPINGYFMGGASVASAGYRFIGRESIDGAGPAWCGIRMRWSGDRHDGLMEFETGSGAGSAAYDATSKGYVNGKGQWGLCTNYPIFFDSFVKGFTAATTTLATVSGFTSAVANSVIIDIVTSRFTVAQPYASTVYRAHCYKNNSNAWTITVINSGGDNEVTVTGSGQTLTITVTGNASIVSQVWCAVQIMAIGGDGGNNIVAPIFTRV